MQQSTTSNKPVLRQRVRAVAAVVTAICVGLGSVLVAGAPAHAANDQGFVYNELNGTAVLTGCDGECPTTLTIPATLGGFPVSRIGPSAFDEEGLTAVTLPEGLTTIWDLAFAGNNLTTLSIPSTVTEIKSNAFIANNIYELVFASGSELNVIGAGAFGLNDLASVSLPDGVVSIGDEAFANNELTSVTLPDDLTSIGAGAFSGTASGVSGNRISGVAIPAGVTSIGNSAFYGNRLGSVSLPDGVASIGDYAFAANVLTSVTLSNDLTSIGGSAFSDNEITSVVFPAGVTEIEGYTFYGNPLTSVTLPAGLTKIGGAAFQGHALTSLVIPAVVSYLGPDSFASSAADTSVRFLGGKPTTLGARVFDGTGDKPIYVPGGRTPPWAGTGPLGGHEVVVVPTPVITSQPTNQTLPDGGTVDLNVTIDPNTPEQGDVTYAWFKGQTKVSGDDAGATFAVDSTGTYHAVVTSWAGSTSSVNVTVSSPVVPPTPGPTPPAPKPVTKKKQSVKVKLPATLKRNRAYKLPAKTRQGRAIAWRVKGPGRCKINKKKRTITCKRTTAKKKFTLTGAAKATTTLYAYKTTIKRKVR